MNNRRDRKMKRPLSAVLVLLVVPLILYAQDTTAPVAVEPAAFPAAAPAAVAATPAVAPSAVPADHGIRQDPEAASTAQQLVAPPGAPLTSTESAELQTTAAVAQQPSVMLTGDELRITDGETTEALAVKSGAELLLKLGLVGARHKPKPLADSEIGVTTPTQIFDDREIRRLIGENPTVVYQVAYKGTPIPDPMIVPWVRNARILQERFDQAVDLLAQKRIREGREILIEIAGEFPETQYGIQAREILNKLAELEVQPPTATPGKQTPTPTPIDFKIDPKIKISTVMVDPANPAENRVMINGRSYAPGDAIRGYPNHRIFSVDDEKVIIEVEIAGNRRQIPVPVQNVRAE